MKDGGASCFVAFESQGVNSNGRDENGGGGNGMERLKTPDSDSADTTLLPSKLLQCHKSIDIYVTIYNIRYPL